MGRRPTTGGVTPLGDRIQLTFTYQEKRLRPTLNMQPSAANLKHAGRRLAEIKFAIRNGTFNLAAEFPDYRFLADHVASADPAAAEKRLFEKVARLYIELFEGTMAHSTFTGYKRLLEATWIPAFEGKRVDQVDDELVLRVRKETAPGVKAKTWNNMLTPVRAVMDLAVSKKYIAANPLGLVKNVKAQTPMPDPFPVDEALAIIGKAHQLLGAEEADYIDFTFAAGLRTSEQIGLAWTKVDLRRGELRIDEARVWGEDKDSTKTGEPRVVKLNPRALAIIKRQAARTRLAADGHVFVNPVTRKGWNNDKKPWKRWNAILGTLDVRYRKPYCARHSSVSWNLMAGENPIWVAKQHGHSVQTMFKNYASWIESDDGEEIARIKAFFANASSLPVAETQSA